MRNMTTKELSLLNMYSPLLCNIFGRVVTVFNFLKQYNLQRPPSGRRMTETILSFVFDIWEVTHSCKEEQLLEVALFLLHLLHCQDYRLSLKH